MASTGHPGFRFPHVAVFDAKLFDDVFGRILTTTTREAATAGVLLDAASVERFAGPNRCDQPEQALLRLAGQHRAQPLR